MDKYKLKFTIWGKQLKAGAELPKCTKSPNADRRLLVAVF